MRNAERGTRNKKETNWIPRINRRITKKDKNRAAIKAAATRKAILKLFVSGLELGHSTFLVGYWILVFCCPLSSDL